MRICTKIVKCFKIFKFSDKKKGRLKLFYSQPKFYVLCSLFFFHSLSLSLSNLSEFFIRIYLHSTRLVADSFQFFPPFFLPHSLSPLSDLCLSDFRVWIFFFLADFYTFFFLNGFPEAKHAISRVHASASLLQPFEHTRAPDRGIDPVTCLWIREPSHPSRLRSLYRGWVAVLHWSLRIPSTFQEFLRGKHVHYRHFTDC